MNIFEEIKSKGNISAEELTKRIEEKKSKFKNMLNDESAAFIVAKELGLNIDDMDITLSTINTIDESSKNVNILGTIESIFPRKDYNSNGKSGFFYNGFISDSTGGIKFTFWNQELNIKVGDIVLVKNAYVNKYKDVKILNTSPLSQVTLKGHKNIESKEVLKKSISELSSADNGVDVEGVLVAKNPIKNFEYQGKQKTVQKFTLYDEGHTISVSVWDKNAVAISEIPEKTKILLKNAYAKQTAMGLELNLGEKGSYEILGSNIDVDYGPKSKKVTELAYDERVKISVSLVERVRQFSSEVCTVCSSKMELMDGRFFCPKCNDYTPAQKKVVLVYKVQDDSGSTTAVFYTKQAYALLGADESNFDEKLGTSNILKPLSLTGALRKTQYADEFVVSKID